MSGASPWEVYLEILKIQKRCQKGFVFFGKQCVVDISNKLDGCQYIHVTQAFTWRILQRQSAVTVRFDRCHMGHPKHHRVLAGLNDSGLETAEDADEPLRAI